MVSLQPAAGAPYQPDPDRRGLAANFWGRALVSIASACADERASSWARFHARNTFRALVRSDDLAVNAELLENLTGTLAECAKFAQAPHGDFAVFDEAQRAEPGR